MDYKRIFKNQDLRFFLLKMLRWLPASTMIRLQYLIKLNRVLNLRNPTRFTEKIQHYKIFYRNPEMLICSDKYLVREFLIERGCKQYLNELYGVFKSADQIDFNALPSKFVIKTSDGGGGENILVVTDKTRLNYPEVISIINKWRNKNLNSMTYEWSYQGARSSYVLVEKYLEDPKNKDNSIDDYKLFCFDGKVEYWVVDVDRYSGHKRNFYDKDFNQLDVLSDCPKANREIKRPSRLKEMIFVAEKLSAGFPFARIDLYFIHDEVIFGEMTFYPWSGYVQFEPDNFDFELGQHFNTNY